MVSDPKLFRVFLRRFIMYYISLIASFQSSFLWFTSLASILILFLIFLLLIGRVIQLHQDINVPQDKLYGLYEMADRI